jgi:hypothetical protein
MIDGWPRNRTLPYNSVYEINQRILYVSDDHTKCVVVVGDVDGNVVVENRSCEKLTCAKIW